jgi:hypothetical protein
MFEQMRLLADVPPDLPALFERAWSDLALPGTSWTGYQRVDIARVARSSRTDAGEGADTGLPESATEMASLIATRPASTSKTLVSEAVAGLGETRYVELVGVVAVVAAVDTVTQLLGTGLEALPEAKPGAPLGERQAQVPLRRDAWVGRVGPPLVRNALSAVPRTRAEVNRLLDRLHVTSDGLRDTAPVRGLSRLQMETLIVAMSRENECFY